MRGHHDLADRALLHPPQQLQEFHLARGRQRRFRLVEDEDALAWAALLKEAHETLAVRMGEKVGWGWAWRSAGGFIQISRDGEKALGPEEPAVGDLRQPAGAQRTGKLA